MLAAQEDSEMKTRDLIAALQEADPSGDIEVAVGNTDIHFVEKLPAYYDGCLQVLRRDPANEYYNIIGAEIRGRGDKLKIHTLSIREMLVNDAEAPVTFDGEYAQKHYADNVEEWRDEMRKLDQEIAAERSKRKGRKP